VGADGGQSPFYLAFDTPLPLGFKGGCVQLAVNLAFSTRLAPPDLLDLSTRVKTLESRVLAEFSKNLFAAVQADQDIARLRQTLPATVRDTVKGILETYSQPTPVEEVLIMEITQNPN
jgi:hypothetical protein